MTARPHAAQARGGLGRWARGGVVALSIAAWAASCGANTLSEPVALSCTQQQPLSLHCQYRFLDGGTLEAAQAQWHGYSLAATLLGPYPQATDSTALLVLVDTSDPARAAAIHAAIKHSEAVFAAAPAHVQLGLSRFDTDLHTLAPIGADRASLHAAAAALAAEGHTTELYRNVGAALRVLAKSSATRKVLLLLSDGLAEDLAYHHDDVIAVARAENIIIDTIGYPRSVAQSVALQTLRRLSEDSGGHFLASRWPAFELPAGAVARMFERLDSGGHLRFDLAPLLAHGAAGALDLSLSLQTAEQRLAVSQAVLLPAAAARVRVATHAVPRPVAITPPARDATLAQAWPWLGGLAALSLVMLAAVLALYGRVRRSAPAALAMPTKALAWLLLAEAPYTRYAIERTPWRIGRGRNADFSLADHSVSRLHAEVRNDAQGALTLHDLASLNGVFVNDTRIETVQLRDGDIVDVGDVRLRFTLHDEHHAALDATVMVRTRTPD